MPQRIYLDYNATAPLHPAARAAMTAVLDLSGNPSSVHAEGRKARMVIEAARADVAGLVGTTPREIVFTSGGTEAANLALTPHVRLAPAIKADISRLVVSAGEHAAVLQGHRFPRDQVTTLPLDTSGVADLAALEALLEEADGPVMLALQAANNETGVVQPVRAAADLVHAHGGIVVCDAVQAAGRIPCDMAALGADMMFVSAHKFGGPKGAGALAFASDALHIEDPLVRGGGQERSRRAGTENVAAIAGFGAAAASALSDMTGEAKRLRALRDGLEARLVEIAPDVQIFGLAAERLPNTSCFAVPGFSAELLLMALDLEGMALSSGSACSSGKVTPSHVLRAMGVNEPMARGALRVSLGFASQEDDINGFCRAFEKTLGSVAARRMQSAA